MMPDTANLITTLVAGLLLALVLGVLANRLRLPPLVGYLLAGVLVGPHTPGFVADQALVPQLAQIGIVLLMFGVGLSFSRRDLLSVRGIAVPAALGQLGAATLIGGCLGLALGWSVGGSLLFGFALSVTSTVVLLKGLQDRHLIETERGKIAVGWLIVEDLLTVLALVLIPVTVSIGAGSEVAGGFLARQFVEALGFPPGLGIVVAVTVVKVAVFLGLMLFVGQRLVPWLLHSVAHSGSRELFRLAVLATALGIAFMATELFGVSIALGAFLAGMVLAESPLSGRAAQETLPLRDAFAVLFFISVGMLFDPATILHEPLPILATVLIIVVVRTVIAFGVVITLGHSVGTAMFLSTSRAQIGEFSFILAGLGIMLGLLPAEAQDLIIGGALISIILNPALVYAGERLKPGLEGWRAPAAAADTPVSQAREPAAHEPERPGEAAAATAGRDAAGATAAAPPDPADTPPSTQRDHTVLIGFGRVGSAIGEALDQASGDYLVIEAADARVVALRERGVEAFVGNAAKPSVLSLANLPEAKVLVIAIPDAFEAGQIAEQARRANPSIRILARAHSDPDAEHLVVHGADVVVMAEREIARGILERLGLSGPDDTATVRSGKAAVTEAAADGDASTTKAEEA